MKKRAPHRQYLGHYVADILKSLNAQFKAVKPKKKRVRRVPIKPLLLLLLPWLAGCEALIKPFADHSYGTTPDTVANGKAHGTLVFLLLGQSNMTGAGQDTDFPSVKGVSMIGGAFRGPGPAFASAIRARNPNVQIILKQYAVGGSPMSHWTPSLGDWKNEVAMYPNATIAGVLFSQGEADACMTSQTPWAQNFNQMVTVIRHDLGNPKLPVIYAQIGYAPDVSLDCQNWQYIQDQQTMVNMPYVSMVKTDDLPKNSQEHYPASSYAEVGRRMAQAFLGLE